MLCIQVSPGDDWDHLIGAAYGKTAVVVNTESLICCVILFDWHYKLKIHVFWALELFQKEFVCCGWNSALVQ